MSLAIETDSVAAVMIGNQWISVAAQSFDLDSYEFVHEGGMVHGGGNSGICATGFTFKNGSGTFSGPLTAIQAVRY